MRIIALGPDSSVASEVAAFGSRGLRHVPLLRSTANAAVDVLHYQAGAVLGEHAAGLPQLLLVVSGSGWVSGADGVRHPVTVGQGARFDAGEAHAAGSAEGMVAVVVQAPGGLQNGPPTA